MRRIDARDDREADLPIEMSGAAPRKQMLRRKSSHVDLHTRGWAGGQSCAAATKGFAVCMDVNAPRFVADGRVQHSVPGLVIGGPPRSALGADFDRATQTSKRIP
jgi:hypothetical protein